MHKTILLAAVLSLSAISQSIAFEIKNCDVIVDDDPAIKGSVRSDAFNTISIYDSRGKRMTSYKYEKTDWHNIPNRQKSDFYECRTKSLVSDKVSVSCADTAVNGYHIDIRTGTKSKGTQAIAAICMKGKAKATQRTRNEVWLPIMFD